MTLSRTARILIAALLVAAAAFFWVNYFNQDTAPAPLTGQPSATPASLAGSPASTPAGAVTVPGSAATVPEGGAVTVPAGGVAEQTPVVAADGSVADAAAGAADPASAPAAAGDAVAAPQPVAADPSAPAVVESAPPVIVPGAPTVVTRDLVVEDLPFLVTSPPSAASAQADSAAAGADRPEVSQRSNINPFSPIVVQAPPAAPVQDFVAQQVPAGDPVIEIVTDGSGQPVAAPTQAAVPTPPGNAAAASAPAAQQAAAPVKAPAPRAVAPASSTVTGLPRPIPSGTLPTTPDILRDARAQTSTSTPTLPDVGTLAALRVPEESQPLALATADGEIPSDGVVTPELIGPDRPDATAAASGPSIPLAVGADLLSRYLRDNNVMFTGTVLGPLSVGVFRSNLYASPVVLTLGQTLPDTDILFTDLRGYEARLSLGERTQILSLDHRR